MNIKDTQEVCDECTTTLDIGDECYAEYETDKLLCTECCFYDEYIDGYIRGTIEESHSRLRVQIDLLKKVNNDSKTHLYPK